jgi:predicted site-specific integrase-resolvase
MTDHPFVTRNEAASMLNISTKTLDRWVRLGVVRKIQAVPNGRVLFRRSEIVDLQRVDEEDTRVLAYAG